MSVERHNELVPELLKRIVRESDGEGDAMVMLESLTFGLMLYYRPNPRHAAEFLDVMTAQVIERMNTHAARAN